jgi:prophage regulatory protein
MADEERRHERAGPPAGVVGSPPNGLRILRTKEVCRRCGLSRATIWRLERAGKFPTRRHLTDCLVGWLECEIDGWISSRAKWRSS